MTTVMLFFAAMAVIIGVIFYFGYRSDQKNSWRREDVSKQDNDPLDPTNL